jgi:glycine hydroxymethyltransferase
VSTILLVCTGNVCRTPMAEGLLREHLRRRNVRAVDVVSAGTAGWEGEPAMPEAVEALRQRGLDITSHVARRLAAPMVGGADLVLAMAGEHREAVLAMVQDAGPKTFTLKELAFLLDGRGPIPGREEADPADALRSAVREAGARRTQAEASRLDEDVPDPLGLGLPSYEAVAWELDELFDRVATAVFGPAPGTEAAEPRDERGEWTPEEGVGGVPSRRRADAESDERVPLVHGEERRGGMRDFVASWEHLQKTDPAVAEAIADELHRERTTLRLIASENYASPAVLAAMSSTMQNKYAEGYPGRRYYGGCQFVDVTEQLAIDRAKELFGAEHANVQPHAGAQANLAVYGAFLTPHDPDQNVLGLVLAHGGHLTHGSPVNVSGKWFTFVGYEVDKDTETIDMDRVRDLALEYRPKLILAGFTAYPRVIDFAAFRQIADEVGALFMVDAAHFIGLVAGGAYPSPVPYADVVTFTTHKTLRGPRGAIILCREEHAKAIDKAVFPMMQGGPLEHVIAAKAVALHEAMQPEFKDYAERTVRTARALADALAEHRLRPISGGTDSHLALIDLQPIGMTGADAEAVCQEVGIAVNKNAIPFDPLPPLTASGIRVGTPGTATLGMDEPEMREIAGIMAGVLEHPDDDDVKDRARRSVLDLMERFPAYPD